jgi:hypothetical protein
MSAIPDTIVEIVTTTTKDAKAIAEADDGTEEDAVEESPAKKRKTGKDKSTGEVDTRHVACVCVVVR